MVTLSGSPFANFRFAGLSRALAAVIIAALPLVAGAQAGQLDTSFGTNGIFANNFGQTSLIFATSVALQSNGQIIVGGEAGNPGIIVRLNANGTIDTSFGANGVVSVRFRDIDNFTVGVAVQTDGKIVVAGTGVPGGGQLLRLNTDGSMDTSFGNNGSIFLNASPTVLLLQPDGKIIISGAVGSNGQRVLMRYTTAGQIDTGFGSGGSAPMVSNVLAAALQPDGKILVGSGPFFVPATSSGTLVRYNADGSIDTIFGVQGQVSDLVGPAGIGVQSNGQIVTAGTVTSGVSLSGDTTGFGLTSYFPATGFPIFLFGTHGGAITPFPNLPMTGASSLAIQTNNFIVAAGTAGTSPSSSEFGLARYAPNGQLDNSFGTGGLVTTSFGNGTASIAAIVLQGDGKIVAVGQASNSGLVVARYLGH